MCEDGVSQQPLYIQFVTPETLLVSVYKRSWKTMGDFFGGNLNAGLIKESDSDLIGRVSLEVKKK